MGNIILDEINEVIVDRKNILHRSYYRSMVGIFSSERGGEIIRFTYGGFI